MKVILSDRLLCAIVAAGKPHEDVWDQRVPGLVIRVGKHGRISFSVVGRQRRGSRAPIRLPIGRYPIVSLADARTRATTMLRDLTDGIDPRTRWAEQKQAIAAKEATKFSVIAEDFIRRHVAGMRSARTTEQRIRNYLIAPWGDRQITEIKRADIIGMVEAAVDRDQSPTAKKNFLIARRLFRWAITRGLMEHAPTDHIKLSDLIHASQPRERVLTEAELVRIWELASRFPYPGGPYIQLLLLLGVRRSELSRAVWSEFELEQALWTIPAKRMKSNETFVVPLPQRAVEILSSLPRFETGPFVFSNNGRYSMANFVRLRQRFDALMPGEPIPHWTFHDLRRTMRTGLSTLKIAPHICELCLAHKQPMLKRIYDKYRFIDEKRHALNAWAAYLLSIVEPSTDKIVPLRIATAS